MISKSIFYNFETAAKPNGDKVQTLSKSTDSCAYARFIDGIKKHCPGLNLLHNEIDISILKNSMKIYEDNKSVYDEGSHDILFLTNLTSFSACFPTVRIPYGTSRYTTNLSLMISTPPGGNKSLMKYAAILLGSIDKYEYTLYLQDMKNWEMCDIAWQVELKNSKKGKEIDYSKQPGEKPQYATFVVSSTTSKSMLIDMMKGNEKYGTVIFSTEANSLGDTNSKEYGKIMDVIAKATVNELVDKAFKVDGTQTKIPFPMVTLLMSGTYDQISCVITSFENGIGSRIHLYLTTGISEFFSQQPVDVSLDYNAYYEELGKEVLEMWKFFIQFRFIVTFTDEQWERHFQYWKEQFDDVKASHADMLSMATREAVHNIRVASTLTMLRTWDRVKADKEKATGWFSTEKENEIVCTDEDFDLSLKITSTLFQHTMAYSTTLAKRYTPNAKEMKSWHWWQTALDMMPEQFTADMFMEVCKAEPFEKSKSTSYNVLNNLSKGKDKVLRKLKTKIDGKQVYEKVNKSE